MLNVQSEYLFVIDMRLRNLSLGSKTFLVSSSRQIVTIIDTYNRYFHVKAHSHSRIGPHNNDVISVLVGCLLGDCHAIISKTKTPGTWFHFKQSGRHKDYLFFLYNFFQERGYCTNTLPREYKTILKNTSNVSKTYYGYEFYLFRFSSLNWLYYLFYNNGTKTIRPELINYLTPMSLAFLIMDDGGWVSGSKSVRIATNNFTKEEVELLRSMFETKFGLNCTVQFLSKKGGNTPRDKYSIYVKVSSLPRLRELVLPYMHPKMLYKLGL